MMRVVQYRPRVGITQKRSGCSSRKKMSHGHTGARPGGTDDEHRHEPGGVDRDDEGIVRAAGLDRAFGQ